MTTVPSVTSPTLPTSAADKAGARLGDTFDDFLKLLTTQLQYQDPLEPMDPKDFVDQLTNLTGVEQSIAQNKNLETIIDKLGAGENGAAVSYLGKEIAAAGTSAPLANGLAKWNYELESAAEETEIFVYDKANKLVHRAPGETGTGEHSFSWNGVGSNGVASPDGLYRIVVSAKDDKGNAVDATTSITGVVTGIESLDDGIQLRIGDLRVPFANVTRVAVPPAPAS